MIRTLQLLLICSVMGATGCAAKYTCGKFPRSGCQPVSTVYDDTNEGVHDYRKDLFKEDGTTATTHPSHASAGHHPVAPAHRALNYVVPGDALLTKPKLMRVLFNSWVDDDGDLNAGGYVYLRLREAEWLMNK